jgi:hypothetical protein
MKHIETEISIDAQPEKIWAVLRGFENYPKWNPFVKSISGDKKVGGILSVTIHPPDGNAMTFKPLVLEFLENSELRWKGKLGIPGIFDGEHYFQLINNGNNQTKFIHGEKFSGILIPFMDKTLDKAKKGFELMNEALKAECEKGT